MCNNKDEEKEDKERKKSIWELAVYKIYWADHFVYASSQQSYRLY